jgi:hypothetical protein
MPLTPDEREDAKLQLDQKRYALDERRLLVDEAKSKTDNLFLNRKFPTLVTAIVSITAVVVSYAQFQIASQAKDRELTATSLKNDQDLKLAAAKFVSDNAKFIFEGTPDEQARMRSVILASFPADVSNALFTRLEQSASSPQAATTWSEGQKEAAAIVAKPTGTVEDSPRVFLHYQDSGDVALLDSLMSELRAKGYRVPGRQLVTQTTQGDIRFYHAEDQPTVDQVAALVEQFLTTNGRPLSLKHYDLSKQYPNVPKGVIEVWLPKKK